MSIIPCLVLVDEEICGGPSVKTVTIISVSGPMRVRVPMCRTHNAEHNANAAGRRTNRH